jgi:hypothetical protein
VTMTTPIRLGTASASRLRTMPIMAWTQPLTSAR